MVSQNKPATQSGYSNIIVHVDPGQAAAQRAELASKLADRFEARLVGVAAEEPLLQYYEDRRVALGEQLRLEPEI